MDKTKIGDDIDSTQPDMSGISGKPNYPCYIGTKIVQATPMLHDEWLKSQNRYQDNQETLGDGYMVIYEDGYKSWSPRDVFERSYRKITNKERSMIL